MEDLQKALQVEPNNEALRKELRKIGLELEKFKGNEKKAYSGIFTKDSSILSPANPNLNDTLSHQQTNQQETLPELDHIEK